MEKVKILLSTTLCVLSSFFFLQPAVADEAADSTRKPLVVEMVRNYNAGIPGVNYTATLDDGTVFGFYDYWTSGAALKSITTAAASIAIPDSVCYSGRTFAVNQIGYGDSNPYLNLTSSPTLTELSLPPTVTYIYSLPSSVKTLHLASYYNLNDYSPMASVERVYVPERELGSFYGNAYWRKSTLILAEGKEPFKLTINMTKENEFAQKVLEATDNTWLRVNELTVTGPLSTTDLNNFSRLEQVTRIDLSGAQLTDLPANFSGDYGRSYEGLRNLKTIILPKLNRIGNYALGGCVKLTDITMPEVKEIGEDAFRSLGASTITLPEGLTTIGNYAFSRSSLQSIVIPSTITTIPSYCFYENRRLQQVIIPSSVTQVNDYAFGYTGLKTIELPNVSVIQSHAFYDCDSLTSVSLPKVQTIGYEAFSSCGRLKNFSMPQVRYLSDDAFEGCYSLETIDLPATFEGYNYDPFNSWSALKTIICRAVAPPYESGHGNECIIGGGDKTNITLYVPAMSVDAYRAHAAWKYFYNIKPLDEKIKVADISDIMTVDDGSGFAEGCDMTIRYNYYTGALNYSGLQTISMSHFNQLHKMGDYDSRSQYYYNVRYTSLIANGPMRADSVSVKLQTQNNYIWYFITLPFNVKVSDITASKDCQWVIREYSGANRAAKDGSDTWLNLTEDSVMQAYRGYIFRTNASELTTFTFPAINDTYKNNIFNQGDVVLPLEEHLSEFAHNRSWNLVGNPYPCYFDTRFMNLKAPITVWNRYNSRYDAYSLVDDHFILTPSMAFFVQRPTDQSAIIFNKEGRQTNDGWRTIYNEVTLAKAQSAAQRQLYNLTLSDGTQDDRTRFVINAKASCDYEIDKDASKLMPANISSVQLYTLQQGVRYAINERPVGDGVVELGVYTPNDGTYTLSLDEASGDNLTLIDRELRTETVFTGSYTFSARAGYNDGRLVLRLGGTTGIRQLGTDTYNNKVKVYTLDGRYLGSFDSLDKAPLQKGVYVVEQNNVTRKTVVK